MKSPNTPNQSNNIVLNIKAQEAVVQERSSLSLMDLVKKADDFVADMNSITLKEQLLFFDLLGTMNNAGLSIVDSLSMLKKQTKNPKMVKIIESLKHQVESGSSLAEALRYHDDIFDEATCSIIEAGEKSGKLNAVIKELVTQFEKMSLIQSQVKGVLMSPMITVCAMIALTIVVLIFVIPKLEAIFEGSENLPLATRIMVEGSDFLVTNWWAVFLGVALAWLGFNYWKKSKAGGRAWSSFVLSAPIFGGIQKKLILSRVTRIFGFLLNAGVPIVEALKITSSIAENPLYKEKLLLASDDISKGISIAENLSDDERLFPEMLVSMIAIGEKTANLDTVMNRVANFYDEDLNRGIKSLSKLMEPFVLTVIAAGAVFMIAAIYLPILKMSDLING